METQTETPVHELLIVEETEIELSQAFSPNGLDPVLDKIRNEAMSHVPDTTTVKGRTAIASVASKVAKSKTGLDQMRLDLVAEMKGKCKIIDAEGKRMKDILDELKVEVCKPLTDWETADEARKFAINEKITWMKRIASTEETHGLSSSTLQNHYDCLKGKSITTNEFHESLEAAKGVYFSSLERLQILIDAAKKSEADAVELQRLRKKEADAESNRLKKEAEQVEKDAVVEAERKRVDEAKSKIIDGYKNGILNIAQFALFDPEFPPASDSITIALDYLGKLDIKDAYGEMQEVADQAFDDTKEKLEALLIITKENEAAYKKECQEKKEAHDKEVADQATQDEQERIIKENEAATVNASRYATSAFAVWTLMSQVVVAFADSTACAMWASGHYSLLNSFRLSVRALSTAALIAAANAVLVS